MQLIRPALLALLLPMAAWAQTSKIPLPPPAPMTATEAMLGRCVADSAVFHEQAQKALADAEAKAAALAAYWAAWVGRARVD